MPRAPRTPSPQTAPAAKRPRQTADALAFPRKMAAQTLSHDGVAERAYELFVEGGRQHGHDLEHWLMAERELAGSAREAS